LLKFNKSKNLKEIIENRKEKYSIRDDRLRNFQTILSQPRSVYSKEKKLKIKTQNACSLFIEESQVLKFQVQDTLRLPKLVWIILKKGSLL
jgi:hypothetical protein